MDASTAARPATRKLGPRDLRGVADSIRLRARIAREPAPFVELIATAPLTFRVRWQSRPRPEKIALAHAPRILRVHVTDPQDRELAAFDTLLADANGTRPVTIRHDRAHVRAEVGWLLPDGTLAATVSSATVPAIPGTPSPVRSDWLLDLRRRSQRGKSSRPPPPPAIAVAQAMMHKAGAGLSGEGRPRLASGHTGLGSASQGWPLPRARKARGKRR